MSSTNTSPSPTQLPREVHITGVSADNGSNAFATVNLGRMYVGVPEDRREDYETKASACRDALFLTDPHIDRERLISTKGRRVDGTCDWITRNPVYQTWLSGESGLLWISGSPGKGKTMLSIFLTEELGRLVEATNEGLLLFYFCNRQDEKCNTPLTILRSLIWQLISHRPTLADKVFRHFESGDRKGQTVASFETLWVIFRDLILKLNSGPVLCVVDGLDECVKDSLGGLVPRLVEMFSLKESQRPGIRLKLVIISRDIIGLHGCMRIRLDPDNNSSIAEDLNIFITVRIRELSRIDGFDDSIRQIVRDTLAGRSEGTFLWIGFVVHELLKKQTCTQVLEALEVLPKGLPELYAHMLVQIEKSDRTISSAILRWVTMASRPLRLQELAAAVGITSSHFLSADQAVFDRVALCKPLLEVQGNRVLLVHQSVRDYLLGAHLSSHSELSEFWVDVEKAHFNIARICLDTISSSGLKHGIVSLRSSKWPECPLLDYAALHWAQHAKSSGGLAAHLLESARSFFKSNSCMRQNWWLSCRSEFYATHYWPKELPALHMACLLGILPWVRKLCHKWRFCLSIAEVNRRDRSGQTAINCAASAGNYDIVKYLIARGADIHVTSLCGLNALSAASKRNRIETVQLLLDNGAAANQDNYIAALERACFAGNERVVRLLLPYGEKFGPVAFSKTLARAVESENTGLVEFLLDQDVKFDIYDPQEMLIIASGNGHGKAALWLLAHGATLDGWNGVGSTALCRAVSRQQNETVQLLLAKGAKVNKTEKWSGRTGLHYAAFNRDENMVQLLLDHKVEINALDITGCSALYRATKADPVSAAVVKLLLHQGADPNITNNREKRALYQAAKRGCTDAVELLLEYGADVNAQQTYEDTAQLVAPYTIQEENTQPLLRYRPKVNQQNTDGDTALHVAAHTSHEGIVQLLLEHGAGVSEQNIHRQTALHMAACTSHKGVIQLLLDHGARVNEQDIYGDTALHTAAQARRGEIVQLLLRHGARVDKQNKDGNTALHVAAYYNCEENVQLLLQYGARVDKQNTDGDTALHLHQAGYYSTDGRVVEVFLQRGANVDTRNKNGKTVLDMAFRAGNAETVQLLLEHGAIIGSAASHGGITAL